MQKSSFTAESARTTHLVVGCNGHFGQIIRKKLKQDGVEVWGIDLHDDGESEELLDQWIQGSITEATEDVLGAVRRADCVWLCLPEPNILGSLSMLATEMRATACIADIAAVKTRIASTVARLTRVPGYLSIHPMFGPIDRFSGLNVLTVRLCESPATKALEQMLESWGVHLSYLTADEHDLLAAYVQVLPHALLLAFGDTLLRSGEDCAALRAASTPIQKLMTILLSRVLTNTPTAYWSIQAHNPYAPRVRRQALDALQKLDHLSEKPQQLEFDRLLTELTDFLHPDLPALCAESKHLVEMVRETALKEWRAASH